jgi:hypothetical protein
MNERCGEGTVIGEDRRTPYAGLNRPAIAGGSDRSTRAQRAKVDSGSKGLSQSWRIDSRRRCAPDTPGGRGDYICRLLRPRVCVVMRVCVTHCCSASSWLLPPSPPPKRLPHPARRGAERRRKRHHAPERRRKHRRAPQRHHRHRHHRHRRAQAPRHRRSRGHARPRPRKRAAAWRLR